jgi:aspartate-semialdehyde dehydrogenase
MRQQEGRKKRAVVVLGATGAVGQRFVQLLAGHPWFEISALAASERSAGKAYGETCRWTLPQAPPEPIITMEVAPLDPETIRPVDAAMPIAFSALPADIAREVEPRFAAAGYAVCSNASAFRYEADVPILVPEVNPEHVALLAQQRSRRGWSGFIVTNPNCTTSGMSIVLKPLDDAFGLRRVFAATLQAVSGAGYPGVPALDITGNVLPQIPGEEEKIARETRLLLGRIEPHGVAEAPVIVSAQANRVPVIDGHTVCLSLGFERPPSPEEAAEVLARFRAPDPVAGLPSEPDRPIRIHDLSDRPQPRLDRDAGGGMTTSVGRIRPCPLLDLRLVLVAHNTIRGAAGGSIVNAEMLVETGVVG